MRSLNGNLVILDGEKFKNHKLSLKPKKYYIFYYTASWCRTMPSVHSKTR